MALTISDRMVDKYFNLLKGLDNASKIKLIALLKNSIKTRSNDEFKKVASLYGAWEDDRDSDEIIADIRNSRVNSTEIESFDK